MANKRVVYDFCPRCNGLMKDGICMACGFEKGKDSEPAKKSSDLSVISPQRPGGSGDADEVPKGMSETEPKAGTRTGSEFPKESAAARLAKLQTPKKSHTGAAVAVLVGCLVFLALLGVAIYLIVSDINSRESAKAERPGMEGWQAESRIAEESQAERTGSADGEEHSITEEEFLNAEDYTADPSDEYYEVFTNAVREDLPYGIEWKEYDAQNGNASMVAQYPLLTGDIPNRDELNDRIRSMGRAGEGTLEYMEELGMDDAFYVYIGNQGYVAYMDEDVVSIIVLEVAYLDDGYGSWVWDLNIDVKTGEILEHGDMVNYTDSLPQKVSYQNAVQNSVDMDGLNFSDNEIMELLKGEEGIAFYTPVGLEVGFHYEDEYGNSGWLTVTLKEEEYRK